MAEKDRMRTEQVHLFLLPEEHELLRQKAGEFDLSKSEFLRQLIVFGGIQGVPRIDDEKFRRLIYEVNRIGNNINQIAYYANSKNAYCRYEMLELQSKYAELLSLYEERFFD